MPKVLEDIDIGEVEPAELIDAARSRGVFVWDLETTGTIMRRSRIEGIAFYVPAYQNFPDLRAWYPFVKGTMRCHVRLDESPEEQSARMRYERTKEKSDLKAWSACQQSSTIQDLREAMPQAETVEALRPLFENSPDTIAVAHNCKFDVSFMKHKSGCEQGWWMPATTERSVRLADSMLADFLCDENHYVYGLKKRTRDLFDHEMVTYKDIMRNRTQQVFGFLADQLKADALGTYAMDDCYWTWMLFKNRMEKLDELTPGQMLHEMTDTVDPEKISPFFKDRYMGNFERIFWGIDMKIALVLEEMESQGILIDWRWLKKVTDKLNKKKEKLLSSIEKKIGYTINPNAAGQVSTLLFAPPPTGLGLSTEGVKQGKKGQYSTGSAEISHLSRVDPIVKELLDWRSADTIIGNFSEKLTRIVCDDELDTERVFSHFNQTGTKIYRLSCISGSSKLAIRLGDEKYRRSISISELLRFRNQTVRIVTHKGRERRITHLINKGPGFMFDVETDDGRGIRCTAEHRFYTERGWRALKDIQPGDRLLRAEICEAKASGRGAPMGVRSPVVPADLRGGHAGRALEDPRLQVVERDRAVVQGDLRVGVYSLVQGHADQAAGLERDPARVPNVDSTREVQGLCADAGVVQDRVRGQRSATGGVQEKVRHLAPSHDPRCQALQRVRVSADGEAWANGVSREEGRYLFQEGGTGFSSIVVAYSQFSARDCSESRSWRLHRGDGPLSSRVRADSRERDVLVGAVVGRRVRGVVRAQPVDAINSTRFTGSLLSSRGNVSAPHDTRGSIEAKQRDSWCEGSRRNGGTSASNFLSQQGRDAVVPSADRSWDSAPTPGLLLQELASGLCVGGEEVNGRGRRHMAPEVPEDQGQGCQEDEEGEGTWLQGVALHDGRGGQEAAHGDSQDRAGAWARIASITPVGIESVWDITVEEDASYVAQGFVNHNSSKPINLQNQPRERGLIRKAFCAYLEGKDPDMLLFGCDYSQVELRVAAHLSGDAGMIETYMNVTGCKVVDGEACETYKSWACDDGDCGHKWTPALWDVPNGTHECPNCKQKEHTEHMKRCRHVDLHTRTAEDAGVPRNPLAKNLNFGVLYRMGAPRFCQYADLYDDKGKPRVEYAQSVIDAWYTAYPGIQPFHEKTEWMLKGKNKWIAYTISGRARRLQRERWKNEYRAVTQGIQFQVSGSAQDIIKVAMFRLFEARNRKINNTMGETRRMWMKFRQIIQVHDEIMCEGPSQLKDEIIELMTYEMENAAVLRVPLKTDVRCGRSWDDVH